MSINIFTDNNNKELLWEILQDSFDKIDQNDYSIFKSFFEIHIEMLNKNMEKNGNNELLEQNKMFIQDTLALIKNNQWKYRYNKQPYTSDEVKERSMNEFEMRFVERQKEFTNLIGIKKPEELSFKDNNSDFNQDINVELERMQREREKEIDFNNQYENNNGKKIQILDDEIPKKKVTFNNLIDSIERDDTIVKDIIKNDFINDIKEDISFSKEDILSIKEDISFIKEEVTQLKNTMNLLLNSVN